jgi:energy-coupling factor transporter ATP-binding protein EcfA2
MNQSSSDHSHGWFVSVDGPSGAGKSTIVEHLAQLLVASGGEVHVTAEPSSGPIGRLCRELTETVTGYALACLYAADRYHHVEVEVRSHTEAGGRSSPTATFPPASSCNVSTASIRRSCGSSTQKLTGPTWP